MIDLTAIVADLTERPAKPTHYKVVSISIYNADLVALDEKVAELKRRGRTKMSRSELIRLALAEYEVRG